MKKTEKIEIRFSHVEKTALSKLAEQEGRTVSELVRSLVKRYMELNTASLPRKIRWGRLTAIAIIGLLIGHLGTYFFMQANNNSNVYQLTLRVFGPAISVPITSKDKEQADFVIPREAGDILIKTLVNNPKDKLGTVKISLCQMQEDICDPIAAPVLGFDPTRMTSVRFGTDRASEVKIDLLPPTKS
jgi:hypothetical protein